MPTTDELMDEGNSALAIGELDDAVKYFQQVVDQDPQFQDGWHALGMALYKLDRYEEAIEAGKRAAAGAKARIISWGGKIKLDAADSTSSDKSPS